MNKICFPEILLIHQSGYQWPRNLENFVTKFTPYFEVFDATSGGYDIEKGLLAINDTKSIQNIVSKTDADGGIIVTNSYGYELSWDESFFAGDLVQNALETVISKKAADWFQSLSGPSTVLSYDLVSDSSIVNQNGEVIWRFCGKASAMPSPLSGTANENLEEFTAEHKVVQVPDQEQTALEKIYQFYVEYLAWVLESDFKGSPSPNYFTDYPAYDKKSNVTIFPALDATHVPIVRTAEEIKNYKEESDNSLLNLT